MLVLILFLKSFSSNSKLLNSVQIEKGGKNFVCPKIVWSYWDYPSTIPEDVEEIMNITKSSLANFTHIFVSEENLTDFLNVSLFPSYYSKLLPASKADYLRLCLIERYGGIWADNTIIINSKKEMEKFFFEGIEKGPQYFGFGNKPGHIFTNFFGACKDSKFVKKYKGEFDKLLASEDPDQDLNIHYCPKVGRWGFPERLCKFYYLIDIFFFKTRSENPHLLKEVFSFPPDNCHYKLELECKRRGKVVCQRDRLLNDPAVRKFPFIKLDHRVRDGKKINFKDRELDRSYKPPDYVERKKRNVTKTEGEKSKRHDL